MNDNYDDMQNEEGESADKQHDLTLGDICSVGTGKDGGKTVLVIKAGIQTKFGLRAITVEYSGENKVGPKVWANPTNLIFQGRTDITTAEAVKEADYQEWKAKKQAGVTDFKQPKPWEKKATYFKKKESSENEDNSFRDDIPF